MDRFVLGLTLVFAVAACGREQVPPQVETSSSKNVTAPQPMSKDAVVPSASPALAPPPPSTGTPSEPPKTAPGPAKITPQSALEKSQQNVDQAKDAAARAVEAAKEAAKK